MHKKINALLLATVACAWGCATDTKEAAPEADDQATTMAALSEDEKTLYALGAMLGRNAVQPLRLSEAELELLQKGIASTARGGEPEFSLEEYGPKFDALMKSRAAEAAAEEKERSKDFLADAASEEGAVQTASGLVFRTLKAGQGASPAATDVVKVHYHGTLTDGTVFDSSRERGEPAVFPLNRVIDCWTEGVQKMKVGETARLVCPANIAYGDRGQPGIPPGATLVFEVELLEIQGQ